MRYAYTEVVNIALSPVGTNGFYRSDNLMARTVALGDLPAYEQQSTNFEQFKFLFASERWTLTDVSTLAAGDPAIFSHGLVVPLWLCTDRDEVTLTPTTWDQFAGSGSARRKLYRHTTQPMSHKYRLPLYGRREMNGLYNGSTYTSGSQVVKSVGWLDTSDAIDVRLGGLKVGAQSTYGTNVGVPVYTNMTATFSVEHVVYVAYRNKMY